MREKSAVSATLQTSKTMIASNQQNLNNSTKINQKSSAVNFGTKTISSPSGNYHFRDSINSNDNSQRQPKFYPIPNENVSTVAKCSGVNDTSEMNTSDIPRPDSTHSTLNSRGSADGYHGDCSSINSLHSTTELKDGMNRRQNGVNEFRESLSSRLSRGFLEFTQGSSDRLQKWKNKLQNGRRHKDSSEPPPLNRLVWQFHGFFIAKINYIKG